MDIYGLFGFQGEGANLKVARFENDDAVVDTCAVTDSKEPYETGITHPAYNNGHWIIVEMYNTKEEAETGHSKWVKIMTSAQLPDTLKDVSTSAIANLCDNIFIDKDWRQQRNKRNTEE